MASYGFTRKHITQSAAQNPAALDILTVLRQSQKLNMDLALGFSIPSGKKHQ